MEPGSGKNIPSCRQNAVTGLETALSGLISLDACCRQRISLPFSLRYPLCLGIPAQLYLVLHPPQADAEEYFSCILLTDNLIHLPPCNPVRRFGRKADQLDS